MTEREKVERYLKQHKRKYHSFGTGFVVYAEKATDTKQEAYLKKAYPTVKTAYLYRLEDKQLFNTLLLLYAITRDTETVHRFLEEMVCYNGKS